MAQDWIRAVRTPASVGHVDDGARAGVSEAIASARAAGLVSEFGGLDLTPLDRQTDTIRRLEEALLESHERVEH